MYLFIGDLESLFERIFDKMLPGKIKFTVEHEEDGKLPYLDTMISRNDNGTLIVDWYQKPTASNRVLNFLSQHPRKQKESVAYGFFHRVLTLADDEFREKNVEKIINILKANNYPWHVIKKALNKFNSLSSSQAKAKTQQKECEIRRKRISYFPLISEDIKRVLRSSPNIMPIFKPMNQLGETVFTWLNRKLNQKIKSI